MGLNLKDALGIHPAALQMRAARAQLIASNLANENTPGYQARDLDFRASLQRELGASPLFVDGFEDTPLYRLPFAASRDGNTVELGVEQAEFAQNAVDLQSSLAFLNLKLKGLSAVINGGSQA